MTRGECLCCSRIKICPETSVQKILSSYTCPFFSPVDEPIYQARIQAMKVLGEMSAASAMMERPEQGESLE